MVSGRLACIIIDADGRLSLEVSGALKRGRGDLRIPGSHRIVGELDDFSTVSLDRCFLRSWHAFGRAPLQTWHVHEAIFGAMISAEEPWAFYEVSLAIPGLTRWVQWSTTDPIQVLNEDGSAERIDVSVPLACWPLWRTAAMTVDLARRAGTCKRSETLTEVESSVVLRVRSSQLIDHRQLHEVAARPLQVLLGLATGQYTAMTRADVTVAGSTPEERIVKLPWRWQPMKSLLDPDTARYAFTYSDLSTVAESALSDAVVRLSAIEPVLDLYLASLRELSYAELSFNVVVQALETYHRSRHEGQLLSNELWTSLQGALGQVIDDTLLPHKDLRPVREALRQRLNYFNELGLRQRLRDLLARVEPHAEALCGGAVKPFVNAVVDTRNYYTHWSPPLATKALRASAAVYLTSRLRALLEILLLRDLGFATDSAPVQAILERRIRWLPTGLQPQSQA